MRDVRAAWLNANAAYDRLGVSQQFLQQADQALDWTQTRDKLGLGFLVGLNHAQLQQTQTQMRNVQAGYDYRLALAALCCRTSTPGCWYRVPIGQQ